MSAGKFNRQGMLQQPSTATDDLGQPVAGWVDAGLAWAHVLTQNGAAAIKAEAKTSSVQASVRLRYREDVRPGWRFVYQATVYSVKAVAPDLERKRHVDLVCEVSQ